MSRLKSIYRCQECGHSDPKGMGQCPACSAWNTMIEEVIEVKPMAAKGPALMISELSSSVVALKEVETAQNEKRVAAGLGEFDRLLGGGLVPGQVVLLAGPPGIGKSTLMLQVGASLAQGERKLLYVSGEESLRQVSSRAQRLKASSDSFYLLSETNLAKILETIREIKPWALVIDSIQTVYHPDLASSPGSVAQVRECAAELVRAAKSSETVIFLLGHVTKDGTLAGPKVLEHIVDTVLYFDTESHDLLRVLRAAKNRFGPTDEIGLFEMTESGLREVRDASSFFIAEHEQGAQAGRAVSVTMEGSRPLLVEVQALVVPTRYPLPRRMATGLDLNRVLVLLAAMERHLRLRLESRDVYVSLAGGLRLKDPALDLAVCLAVASSAWDAPIPADTVMLGEVSLLGAVSRVPYLENRLREAAKAGFKKAVAPKRAIKEMPRSADLALLGVSDLQEAAGLFFHNQQEDA